MLVLSLDQEDEYSDLHSTKCGDIKASLAQ